MLLVEAFAEGSPMAQVRDGARTSAAIREAAAELFYTRGYQASSLRDIASAVGLQVGSLYNHLRSKDELLIDIMTSVMRELNDALDEALVTAPDDAVARIEAAVGCHIRYHAEHAREVFIGNSELRSLNAQDRERMHDMRRAYEERIRGLVDALAWETGANVMDPRLQTYMLLGHGPNVASLYRPDRPDVPRSIDQVVDVHVKLAMRHLDVKIDESADIVRPAATKQPVPTPAVQPTDEPRPVTAGPRRRSRQTKRPTA